MSTNNNEGNNSKANKREIIIIILCVIIIILLIVGIFGTLIRKSMTTNVYDYQTTEKYIKKVYAEGINKYQDEEMTFDEISEYIADMIGQDLEETNIFSGSQVESVEHIIETQLVSQEQPKIDDKFIAELSKTINYQYNDNFKNMEEIHKNLHSIIEANKGTSDKRYEELKNADANLQKWLDATAGGLNSKINDEISKREDLENKYANQKPGEQIVIKQIEVVHETKENDDNTDTQESAANSQHTDIQTTAPDTGSAENTESAQGIEYSERTDNAKSTSPAPQPESTINIDELLEEIQKAQVDIAALTGDVDQKINDAVAAIQQTQNTAIDELNKKLQKEIADRQQAITDTKSELNNNIDGAKAEVNGNITTAVEGAKTDLNKNINDAKEELNNQIDTTNQNLADTNTSITNAKNELGSQIDTTNQNLAETNTNITNAKNELDNKIDTKNSELQEVIQDNTTNITTNTQDIKILQEKVKNINNSKEKYTYTFTTENGRNVLRIQENN